MTIWPGLPPEIARLSDAEVGKRLQQFVRDYCGFQDAYLDRRGVGSGKTWEALAEVALQAQTLGDGEVIYCFAPTTVLCEDIRKRLVACDRSLVDKCLTWRGRSAIDPVQNQPMCLYHEAADVVSKRGGDPEKTLCKSKDHHCQHYETCGYRAQRREIDRQKIIIMPHSMLSLAPRKGMGIACFVIIDEDPYSALLDEPVALPLDDIIAPIAARPEAKKLLTMVLSEVHAALNNADGVISCEGLPDAERVNKAIKLLYDV